MYSTCSASSSGGGGFDAGNGSKTIEWIRFANAIRHDIERNGNANGNDMVKKNSLVLLSFVVHTITTHELRAFVWAHTAHWHRSLRASGRASNSYDMLFVTASFLLTCLFAWFARTEKTWLWFVRHFCCTWCSPFFSTGKEIHVTFC